MTGNESSPQQVPDYLALSDSELSGQCEIDTYRASGPGGQKRNKTDSAVRFRHLPTGLIATAVESRSQHENRAKALKRLRKVIAMHVRRPIDPENYKPCPLIVQCINKHGRLVVGRRDVRYPQVVQEVLDCLVSCSMQLSTCAACLGISTACLSKFVSEDPNLWKRVNEMRADAGLSVLRLSK